MSWKKYNTQGWQGREDYIKLNSKAIYIPNFTLLNLLKEIDFVDLWYDKEKQAISLKENKEGLKIAKFKRQAHIGTSLSRSMPKGWYTFQENGKDGIIFVLKKMSNL